MLDVSKYSDDVLEVYIRKLFRVADVNGDGVLEESEMRRLLSKSGFGFDEVAISTAISGADANGDGVISYDEFVPMMSAMFRSRQISMSTLSGTVSSSPPPTGDSLAVGDGILGPSPRQVLSATHCSTTANRALAAAVPMREDVEAQVTKLEYIMNSTDTVYQEVDDKIMKLHDKCDEANRAIDSEFEAQMRLLQDAMEMRRQVLRNSASEHYQKLEDELSQKKEQLLIEKEEFQAKAFQGVEALALDDAWLIQAYPDLKLEPGSSAVEEIKQILLGTANWKVNFNPSVNSNVNFAEVLTSVANHGLVHTGAAGHEIPDYEGGGWDLQKVSAQEEVKALLCQMELQQFSDADCQRQLSLLQTRLQAACEQK